MRGESFISFFLACPGAPCPSGYLLTCAAAARPPASSLSALPLPSSSSELAPAASSLVPPIAASSPHVPQQQAAASSRHSSCAQLRRRGTTARVKEGRRALVPQVTARSPLACYRPSGQRAEKAQVQRSYRLLTQRSAPVNNCSKLGLTDNAPNVFDGLCDLNLVLFAP